MGKLQALRQWLVSYCQKTWPLLVATGIAFLICLTPLKLFGLLLLMLVTARLLKKWFGFITAIVISYLLFSGFVAAVSLVIWQLNGSLTVALVTGLWALVILVVLAFFKRPPKLVPSINEVLTMRDILPLVAAILVGIMISLPVIGSTTVPTMAKSIIGAGDNSAHLDLVKSIDLNRGAVYGQQNRFNALSQNDIYPQGWHVNVALLKWFLDPLLGRTHQYTALIVAFYIGIVTWYMLFVYMLVATALYAVEKYKKWYVPLVALVPISAVLLGWLITMFAYGHQPHTAASTFYLLSLLTFGLAYRQSDKKDKSTSPLVYMSLIAATASIMCYYYMAPLVVLSFGVIYIMHKRRLRSWPNALEIIAGAIALYFCVLQVSFRYIYAFLTLSDKQSIYDVSGLVAKSDYRILVATYLLAVLGWLYFRKERYLDVLMAVATILLGAIGLVRLSYLRNHTEPGYYIFKLNLTFILVMTVIFAVLLILYASTVDKRLNKKSSAIAVSIVLLLGVQLSLIVRSPLVGGYFRATNFGIEQRQADKLFEVLAAEPMNGRRLIFMGSCNRANDIRATQLARSLTPRKDNDYIAYSPTGLGFQNQDTLFANLKEYARTTHNQSILVINDDQLAEKMQAYLGDDNQYFDIVNIDGDGVNESSLACPERVHVLPPAAAANEKHW